MADKDKVDPTGQGRTNGGDSAGGAYPNPHSGKDGGKGGFMGHGGQSEIGYHGDGQLGKDTDGDNPNATTEESDVD